MKIESRRLRAVAALGLACLLAGWLSPAPAQRYEFRTIAGDFTGDGGQALDAKLGAPVGVALDGSGNLYVAESQRHRIRMITPGGSIRTVLGTGIPGYSSAGPFGVSNKLGNVQIREPLGLVLDAVGNLYFADAGNNRVRKLARNGIVTVVAGNGTAASTGDGGLATNAALNRPYGLAFDHAGNLYVSEILGHRIRRIAIDGTISTVAGNGVAAFAGDGGPATQGSLYWPSGVSFDAAGDLFVADSGNDRIRKIVVGGAISTVVGGGSNPDAGIPATDLSLSAPYGVSFAGSGEMYVTDYSRITRVTPAGVAYDLTGLGFPVLMVPEQVVFSANGDAYFADSLTSFVYRRVAATFWLERYAGRGGSFGDTGPAAAAGLTAVTGVGASADGAVYVADAYPGHRIRRVDPDGGIRTIAGNGSPYLEPVIEGEPATSMGLYYPSDAEEDASGNLYIGDRYHSIVRKMLPDGSLWTIAGNQTYGYSGDGGPATAASLRRPQRVAIDAAGNVYIADPPCHCIRKVDAGGIITTVAGTGTAGFSGDGGAATSAQLWSPGAVAVDPDGDLLIADTSNARVRKVSGGIITTIAGNGSSAYGGDGGPATAAAIGRPTGIDFGPDGSLFIAAGALRKVSPAGTISSMLELRYPAYDVAIGDDGAIYIATVGGRVLKGKPATALTRPGRAAALHPSTITGAARNRR